MSFRADRAWNEHIVEVDMGYIEWILEDHGGVGVGQRMNRDVEMQIFQLFSRKENVSI